MSPKKPKLDTDQVMSDLSESAFFQPTSPQVGKTISGQVDKPTKPQVDKYTTHLRPASIDFIKEYAFKHKMKDYEVVQMAIDLLQENNAQPVEQKTQPRAEVEAHPPGDLVSLQEFANLHAINRNEAERLWKTGMIAGTRQSPTATRYHGKSWPVMLGAKGRRDFWAQFHETPGFRSCDLCPHEMKLG